MAERILSHILLPNGYTRVCTCVICGGPVHFQDQPDSSWRGRFRAVYAMRNSTIANISAPSYFQNVDWFINIGAHDEDSSLKLSFNPNPEIWRESNADEFNRDAEVNPSDSWGYPFHTGCWEVLLHIRGQRAINVQSLFNLVRSFRVHYSMLDFGHEYDMDWMNSYAGNDVGADELSTRYIAHMDPHGALWVDLPWFDVTALPIMDQFFQNDSINNPNTSIEIGPPELLADIQIGGPEPPLPKDAFSKLPTEVYGRIIQYLPLHAVLNLHLASRVCYKVGLDNSFWKSRFNLGHELDFILPGDLPISFPDQDGSSWKSLGQFIWSMKKTDAALSNRRRVCRLAKALNTLLYRAETPSNICAGIPIKSKFEPSATTDTMAWLAVGRDLESRVITHWSGLRPLFHRMVEIPSQVVSVYASIVEFSGNTHISGLRMVGEGGNQVTIGYNISKDESLLTTERIHVAGFMVVGDWEGVITGLAVISTSGTISAWIGAHKGFAKRRLVLDSSAEPKAVRYIKAGFDGYKLYYLSISDGSSSDVNLGSNLDARDQMKWFPEVPSPPLSCTALESRYIKDNQPVSMVLLGDIEREQYKQHNVRITVTFGEVTKPLRISTLEISSRNGTHRALLGRYSHCLIPRGTVAVIRYGDGERIIGLTTFYNPESRLKCFTIHTNFKRNIPFFANGYTSVDQGWTGRKCFPNNKQVVGFYAQTSVDEGLIDLGLVCM